MMIKKTITILFTAALIMGTTTIAQADSEEKPFKVGFTYGIVDFSKDDNVLSGIQQLVIEWGTQTSPATRVAIQLRGGDTGKAENVYAGVGVGAVVETIKMDYTASLLLRGTYQFSAGYELSLMGGYAKSKVNTTATILGVTGKASKIQTDPTYGLALSRQFGNFRINLEYMRMHEKTEVSTLGIDYAF